MVKDFKVRKSAGSPLKHAGLFQPVLTFGRCSIDILPIVLYLCSTLLIHDAKCGIAIPCKYLNISIAALYI